MSLPLTPTPPASNPTNRIWKTLADWIRLHFNADHSAIERTMRSLIGIQNDKFWFLIAAAIIASVGLNTNSPAVVIGAMLVSPLMGPIVGIGYALAIRDKRLAFKAGRHLLFAIAVSLFVSIFYFFISPLQDATPEILARTRPNLLDLLVALAAALAGVIALASADVAITLPGVAIATAIMPPLCTAGYGIATWQPRLAAGAFFLFLVNAVAIALCSFLLFRRMHVEELKAEDESRMPTWLLVLVTTAFLVPLCLALYDTAQESRRASQVKSFVAEVSATYPVASWEFNAGKNPLLTMFVFQAPTTAESSRLEKSFAQRVPGARLKLMANALAPEVQKTIDDLRNSVIDSNTALQQIQTAVLEQEKQEAPAIAVSPEHLQAEWAALDDRLSGLAIYSPPQPGAPWLLRAKFKREIPRRELAGYTERWRNWLTLRLDVPVDLLIEKEQEKTVPQKR